MLIVALVLAVIGLAALVTAVVTSNELIAWVCIAASVIGVVLLIVDALRERSRGDAGEEDPASRGRRTRGYRRGLSETQARRRPSRRTKTRPVVEARPTRSADEDRTAKPLAVWPIGRAIRGPRRR